MNSKKNAWSLAIQNGIGTSGRLRSMVASTYCISSLKVITSGPPSSWTAPGLVSPATALATASPTSPA